MSPDAQRRESRPPIPGFPYGQPVVPGPDNNWEDGGAMEDGWVPDFGGGSGGGFTPYHQASPTGPAGDENGGETPSVELGNPGDDATQMLTKAF